jgi:hypothetical protein
VYLKRVAAFESFLEELGASFDIEGRHKWIVGWRY